MKRLFALLLIVVMSVSLFAGCAAKEEAPASGEGKAEGKLNIGISISSFDDTFLMYMKDGMDAYAKKLGEEVETTYVDAKEDAIKQLGQVENFIAQGVNAIIVVPVNTEATGPITQACQEANVALVYVNRLPDNLPEDIIFVGSQSIDAGIFQMEYLAEQMGGTGNVVVLIGKLDNEAAIKRTEGVKKVIEEKYPDIKVIKEQTGEWSRAKGMTVMENWLASGDQIDAVASNNDDMALGALMAIEAQGKLDDIIVAGVDATPDALAELEKGRLNATVFQDAEGQGGGAMEAAIKKAKGEQIENRVWIPFQLVTPENYKEFMK
ncbi:sugar ABC transporter substrate-binding protein [Marinisporobacter balticus]|uniref:Monosaccharide ABC transporter substrate-binding protein (CUT2 family) n=1 Tax=Marinisporobacter balticus TaxID=2018667 RepID=A0A4R2KHQ2_9FIRM|nr:sugar ABC transporter substrate-binding protein [Marinisporobacter balticus]TCO70029.1 monosaccharide ABC transporter substrate-binding protein (CUT2 family) [Marinisporobacter balticus]